MTNRRSFLRGLVAAPAVIAAIPLRGVILRPPPAVDVCDFGAVGDSIYMNNIWFNPGAEVAMHRNIQISWDRLFPEGHSAVIREFCDAGAILEAERGH